MKVDAGRERKLGCEESLISSASSIELLQPGPRRQHVDILLLSALGVTFLAAVLRVLLIFKFDLMVDEALYAWIGWRNPFTLAPHPLGVPLLARAMTDLFGRTEWAMRLPPFILMLAMPWVVCILLRQMGAGRLAYWAVILLNAVPLYVGFGAVLTPDSPQIFIWAVLLVLCWQALEKGGLFRWVLLGAMLGFGLCFKYVLVLFVPSLALSMLLVSHWRKYWRSPGPYAAAATTMLFMALLVWYIGVESSMDAIRYHLFDRQHVESMLHLKTFGVFQLAHLAFISPVLYGLSFYALIACARKGVRSQDRRLLFLFSFGCVTLVFFALVSCITERRLSREHWDAPAYVPALAGLVLLMSEGSRTLRKWVATGAGLGILTTCVIVLEGMTGLLTRQVGADPPFSSFRGWREISSHLDRQFDKLPAGPRCLLTQNFQVMVEYAFYGRATPELYKLDDRLDAIWGLTGEWERSNVTSRALAERPGSNVLVVREGVKEVAAPSPTGKWQSWLSTAFQSVKELEPYEVVENGHRFRTFRVYECIDLKNGMRLTEPP